MADEMPDILRTMQPHQLTPLAAARMAVRHGVDPLTGQLTGERCVDPIVTSALALHGIDPEPYARYLLALDADGG